MWRSDLLETLSNIVGLTGKKHLYHESCWPQNFGILNELSALYPLQMRGEAEAFAIGARARAEAEQMAKKAEAFQMYQEAAQLDMLLEKLPQVWRWVEL